MTICKNKDSVGRDSVKHETGQLNESNWKQVVFKNESADIESEAESDNNDKSEVESTDDKSEVESETESEMINLRDLILIQLKVKLYLDLNHLIDLLVQPIYNVLLRQNMLIYHPDQYYLILATTPIKEKHL